MRTLGVRDAYPSLRLVPILLGFLLACRATQGSNSATNKAAAMKHAGVSRASGASVPFSAIGPAPRRAFAVSDEQQQCPGTALCAEASCSLARAPRRTVRAHAALAATEVDAWWQQKAELWHHVESEDDFLAAIDDEAYDLVLVDWYATWCKGCKRAYPELCKLATKPGVQGNVKFVKVCADKLKRLAKREKIKVLPQVSMYRPGVGLLLSMQAVPSKLKLMAGNLQTMLDNPESFFRLDANGFVVAVSEDPSPELRKQAEASAQLASSTSGLFEKLMNSTQAQGGEATGRSHRNGNGAASPPPAFPAAAPPDVGSVAAAKAAFVEQWGAQYGYGGKIDALYAAEVGCRMKPNEHYLDYTGSALYCNTPLHDAFKDLQHHIYGNPHSANPSSTLTSDRIEDVRDEILRFFNASPDEYQVVFTKSATGALQMVGETFPWEEGAVFRYTRENHNSVLGIRAYARQHGASFQAVEEDWVEEWLAGHKEDVHFIHPASGTAADPKYSLFAFPGEENFSGVKYPLRWIREIQSMSTDAHKWKVLLDAAAFVPTQPLDVTQFPADFVSISFYKMFGFPTGLGALLIRTEDVDMMRKVFWGGGTVSIATSADDFHVLKCKPSEKFEDGTVAFLDIINLSHQFKFFEVLGGIEAVQAHVHALTQHLYGRLSSMRHSNGAPLLTIFGKHDHPSPAAVQGGIVNFEVTDPAGEVWSYRVVETQAAAAGFHIRTGIHCNPGAAYRDVGVTEAEVESLAGEKEGCGDEVDFIEVQRPIPQEAGMVTDSDILPALSGTGVPLGHPGEVAMKWVKKPLGSVRVSLGYMSTFEDVEEFCRFMEAAYVDKDAT